MSGAKLSHLRSDAFEERARSFIAAGVLHAGDQLVVDAVAPRYGESDPDVLLALALAVRAPRAGHVGVDLRAVKDRSDAEGAHEIGDEGDEDEGVTWPEDAVAWEARVLSSNLVGDASQRDRPFVRQLIDDGHTLLMTRRMWREQERLADGLRALASSEPAIQFGADSVEGCIKVLFDDAQSEAAAAVRVSVGNRLTITTGGPGTGKTYSVKRTLALMLELTADATRPLRIELAAPTGKAAVRMKQAIEEHVDELPVSERVRVALRALRPRTLHKLLGMRPDGSVRHAAGNPLAADLVIVDEASMVDLMLMRRLIEAMPAGARLVLLGDRDQLASVEVGTVLADLVDGASGRGGASSSVALDHSLVRFTVSRRFATAPTVAEIARLIQQRGEGDLERSVRLMTGAEHVDDAIPDRVKHLDRTYPGAVSDRGRPTPAQLDALAAPYLAADGYVGMLTAAIREHGEDGDALRQPQFHQQLLVALDRYRVLAVHRRGARGVSGIDRAIATRVRAAVEQAIRAHRGLADDASMRLPTRAGHYLGQPVLVTANTYDVGLMNGDVGIVLPTSQRLAAVFPAYEASETGCREVPLARLPAHMGAFAMTVHKSQGSQFQRVALVLAGRESPIETRELIYTGITRTSSRLDWLGDPDELRHALARPVQRASGLRELIWASATQA